MLNFFKKARNTSLRNEWNLEGMRFAVEVNTMVEFVEKNGWEKWEGVEPKDNREHLAGEVIALLKKANAENKVAKFRADFPPSHAPFIPFLKEKGQHIEQLHFIEEQKIVFLTGTSHQKRQAWLVDGDTVTALDEEINAIGKSKQGNVFAIATPEKISVTKGWNGKLLREFNLHKTAELDITDLVPFNDGSTVLLITPEGIYLVSESEEKLIHPVKKEDDTDPESLEWTPHTDMENATISNDNQWIVVGDQDSDHRILDINGMEISSVHPQSSYPHFCLFSKDDTQLITNSCHFYSGITIGTDTGALHAIAVGDHAQVAGYVELEDTMRIYHGLATRNYYIAGDAYGYLRAFDKTGKQIWRHFLGSTISGMAISDDEKTLWAGSCSGMLHKLQLGKGHRDKHTIGNGEHYEEFRLLIWKDEPQVWKW